MDDTNKDIKTQYLEKFNNSNSKNIQKNETLPEDTSETDLEYTRKKLRELVELGEDVLENAKDVASETGEPRSIEVFSNLLKNVGDLTKNLMEAQKIKSAINKDKGIDPVGAKETNLTQNNIFVGTPSELNKLITQGQLPPIENE